MNGTSSETVAGRSRRFFTMCVATGVAAIGLVGASAQGFSNLNFESIGASSISPDGIWVNWNIAAPGWRRPAGGDSTFVYHKTPPQNLGQYYFLVDSAAANWSPLEGDFSLALVSGRYNRNDANSAWVKAYIEQDGTVPTDAGMFTLLARGEFSLSINSSPVPVSHLGGDLYGADIAPYAGQNVTLRVMNEAVAPQMPLFVDSMGFVPSAVPEPSLAALAALGAAAVLARRQRARAA